MVENVESSIMQASRKSVAENKENNPSHVTAWFDGIWQKSGHTSLNDIISATFFKKEEVLGTEIMRASFVLFLSHHSNL